MRPILLLFFLTSLFSFSHAQEKDSVKVAPKTRYFNQFNSGIVLGDNLATVSFHQGLAIKWFRLGMGIGYEGNTEWRIIPVYAISSLDIVKVRENALYIQVHYGGSFAKYKVTQQWGTQNFNDWGGKVFSYLLGYRIKATKYSLYFNGGYSEQKVGYSYNQVWGQNSNHYTMEKRFRNVFLQLGIGLH